MFSIGCQKGKISLWDVMGPDCRDTRCRSCSHYNPRIGDADKGRRAQCGTEGSLILPIYIDKHHVMHLGFPTRQEQSHRTFIIFESKQAHLVGQRRLQPDRPRILSQHGGAQNIDGSIADQKDRISAPGEIRQVSSSEYMAAYILAV